MLSLCGPDVEEIMLSNDAGFVGAVWQPYTRTVPWTLTTYGNHVLSRFVHARFQDNGGDVHGNFFDDITSQGPSPFSGPQRQHLIEVIDALVVCPEKKTLAALQRQYVESTDVSNWADCFRISPWTATSRVAAMVREPVTGWTEKRDSTIGITGLALPKTCWGSILISAIISATARKRGLRTNMGYPLRMS